MSFVKKARFKNRGRVVSVIAGIFTAAMLVFTFVSCEQPEDPVPAPVINITINPAETMVTVGSISGSLTVPRKPERHRQVIPLTKPPEPITLP